MAVLSFDSTDRMRATTLASPLANVPTGARSISYLFKRSATGTNFDALGYLKINDPGATEFGVSLRAADGKATQDLVGGTPPVSVAGFTSTTENYVLVLTIPAGTGVAGTYHWYAKGTNVWTHEASSGSVATRSAANQFEIGAWTNDDWFRGWIGLVGVWNVVLTNPQIEELTTNWRTSDWWGNTGGQPVCLTELTSTSPTDLAGNATGWTNTGTTADAGETLNSFNFNGTGSAATPSLIVPRRAHQNLIMS